MEEVEESENRVYHYTSIDAVQKILLGDKDKKTNLWATHHAYLNDEKEFTGEIELIKNQFKEKINPELAEMASEILNIIEKDSDLYVCSFSKKPDLLSQWRAYCPKGGGYALGINKNTLLDIYGDRLVKCIYSDEDKINRFIN